MVSSTPSNVQQRVVQPLHLAHCVHQLGQPLQRVIFALDGHQDGVGGGEGIERYISPSEGGQSMRMIVVVPAAGRR